MSVARKSILFDCERMKYPYTGLYSFCLHLTKSLLEQPEGFQFSFYVPEKAASLFYGEKIIRQRSLNKFYLPLKSQYLLWHNTYQNSAYLPSRSDLPVLLTIHDLNFLYDKQKGNRKKSHYIKQLQSNIDRADHLVCISETTRNDINMHLNIHNKPVSVIYNGCSLTDIKNVIPPNFNPIAEFLFTIGTIVAKKNFHVLPALLKNNNLKLIIAGITHNEAYKNQIIHEAMKFGVKNRLVFTGPVSENDKQWYYQHCKAFVFPSVSEGFGLPVIEAMHYGKPVLLSNLTCLPEIGGKAAYYFENFEPKVMQQTLINALHDFEENNRTEQVKKHAAQFSWPKAATKYIEVYNQMLSR